MPKHYRLLPLAACLALGSGSLAQLPELTWQSPLPTGQWLRDADYVDDDHVFACGGGGQLLRSFDGGSTWSFNDLATSEYFSAVQFLGPDTGFLCGSTYVRGTVDGGNSWATVSAGTSAEIQNMYFVDALHGWTSHMSGLVSRTTNGGLSWTVTSIGMNVPLSELFFTDLLHGWVAGYNGVIRRTVDGGITWLPSPSGITGQVTAMWFTDSLSGWAGAVSGTLLRTTDGGLSWTSIAMPTTQPINDVRFVSPAQGWQVCGDGTVFTTADGGATWTMSNGAMEMEALARNSAGELLTVGYCGAIGLSDDGGASWASEREGPTFQLLGVHALDDQHAWAVGNSGRTLRTTDGGDHWTEVLTGANWSLTGVHFTDTLNGWTCGFYGNLFHTTDGGVSWTPDTTFGTPIFSDVQFTDAQHGWLSTQSRMLYRTVDGGATWLPDTIVALGPQSVFDLFFLNDQQGWACGNYGYVYRTVDGGQNWTGASPGGSALNDRVNAIRFTDALNGVAVGNSGLILRTVDGGLTWTAPVSAPISNLGITELNDVLYMSPTEVWIAGDYGTVLHSTDQGATWSLYDKHRMLNIDAASASASHIWFVGPCGNIVRTEVPPIPMSIQAHGSMAHGAAAYPNPGNEHAWFHGISTTEPIAAWVFDVRGAMALHVGRLQPGQYLDVHQLQPGLYTILLTDTHGGMQQVRWVKE